MRFGQHHDFSLKIGYDDLKNGLPGPQRLRTDRKCYISPNSPTEGPSRPAVQFWIGLSRKKKSGFEIFFGIFAGRWNRALKSSIFVFPKFFEYEAILQKTVLAIFRQKSCGHVKKKNEQNWGCHLVFFFFFSGFLMIFCSIFNIFHRFSRKKRQKSRFSHTQMTLFDKKIAKNLKLCKKKIT